MRKDFASRSMSSQRRVGYFSADAPGVQVTVLPAPQDLTADELEGSMTELRV